MSFLFVIFGQWKFLQLVDSLITFMYRDLKWCHYNDENYLHNLTMCLMSIRSGKCYTLKSHKNISQLNACFVFLTDECNYLMNQYDVESLLCMRPKFLFICQPKPITPLTPAPLLEASQLRHPAAPLAGRQESLSGGAVPYCHAGWAAGPWIAGCRACQPAGDRLCK